MYLKEVLVLTFNHPNSHCGNSRNPSGSSLFANQVYHSSSLKAAFGTSRVELVAILLPLISFTLYHVMTAGGHYDSSPDYL